MRTLDPEGHLGVGMLCREPRLNGSPGPGRSLSHMLLRLLHCPLMTKRRSSPETWTWIHLRFSHLISSASVGPEGPV